MADKLCYDIWTYRFYSSPLPLLSFFIFSPFQFEAFTLRPLRSHSAFPLSIQSYQIKYLMKLLSWKTSEFFEIFGNNLILRENTH